MRTIPANTTIPFLATALLALALAGCASPQPLQYSRMPPENGRPTVLAGTGRTLSCVPFARNHSQVKIHGDAVTWWTQAAGHYKRADAPSLGSIMVLHNYAGPRHGHLAVVQKIVSPREIRVDHANWLNDGAVYLHDPVTDVSPDNDWSMVRVWNIPADAWGSNVYPVQGFIGPGRVPGAVAQGGVMGPVAFTEK
jgi:surface antigen